MGKIEQTLIRWRGYVNNKVEYRIRIVFWDKMRNLLILRGIIHEKKQNITVLPVYVSHKRAWRLHEAKLALKLEADISAL